ncbi:hypothetical protein SAMN02745166_01279 [Prosthecobacter debontii]|uniref:Uncharacterized protein n=1 Tax=Prosthecobacter debontii TaxID=48467 RepID=A0A1T4XB07_9BACT|nr:hypothetical protein [Prosthecobacter debontii]SKA86308.1 hypothetical protein SAMN02745166_01279 [Prosthecobacter debontii]
MKTKLITSLFLIATTSLLLAHGGVELGPNKGRILEFSKNETMHGEVTVKDGKFHIALLDKDMKPVAVDKQSLVALTGDRDKPTKLEVSKDAQGFTVPLVAEGQWLIVQYKDTADSKSITARMHYETETCSGCGKAEWVCECKKAE